MRVAVVGTPTGALAAALAHAELERVDAAAPADLALAVDWTAARRLADADAPALALVREDLAERTLEPGDPRRAAARAVDALEAPSLVTAAWLEGLGLGATVRIALGVDPPAVDAPPAVPDGPLPVHAPGREGIVAQALADAREPVRLVDGPAQAAVVLDLGRRERRPGATSEALRHGCAVVATLPPGREELVAHGRNGLVVAWDDPRGTARALDLLARDRALLARLRAGALETARALPSHADAARELAAALRRLAAEPAPDALRERLRALPDPATAAPAPAAGPPPGAASALRGLRRRPRIRRALDALGRAAR
jgi:hypothetical protein